jgi:hypothetical protein
MNWMTLYRLGGLAAVSKLPQRPRRARSIGWFAARFVWAAIALLIIGSLGEAVRAQTPETVPVEIRFDRGASSKAISASVIRGERSLYSIGARAGQRLTLSIRSVEDNAVFQVYAPGSRSTPTMAWRFRALPFPARRKARTPKVGAAFCRNRVHIS